MTDLIDCIIEDNIEHHGNGKHLEEIRQQVYAVLYHPGYTDNINCFYEDELWW